MEIVHDVILNTRKCKKQLYPIKFRVIYFYLFFFLNTQDPRPSGTYTTQTITVLLPKYSCWRTFQAAECSPQRLQILFNICHTCSVWTCSHVCSEQDTSGKSANTDALCKCHSGCAVAGWGWGATLTESASDSLGRNVHLSGLLTVILWVLLLFLLEQSSRPSFCWIVGLLLRPPIPGVLAVTVNLLASCVDLSHHILC